MESEATTDVSDYIAALKRRRRMLAYIVLPIAFLGIGLAIGLPNRYTSQALFSFAVAEVSGELPTRGRQEKEYADQYVSSLRDNVLAPDRLAAALKSPDAPKAFKGEDLEDTIDTITSNANVKTVRVPVLDPDSGREREIVSAFTVGFTSHDPETAHDVARWLTTDFLKASRDMLGERARSSAAFYTAEADRYSKQISALESKLADFKAKNFGQLPELADANMNVMDRNERDVDNVELQLSNLRQSRMFYAAQLEQAKSNSTDATILQQLQAEYARKQAIYDPDHPDLINLRRQIDSLQRGGPAMSDMTLPQQLEAQKAILSETRQRYSADHPDVRRVQRQIDDLQARIARGDKSDNTIPPSASVMQARAQINGIDTQIAGLEARGKELRGKMDTTLKRMQSTPQVEREYKQLTRDLDLAHTKYDELLKARMDSELTEAAILGGRSDEIRVVTPSAVPSEPSKPTRPMIAAVGIVLALILGLAAVVLMEAMDQTVRGSRDVKRVLSVAPLAVIPQIQDAASLRRMRFRMVMLTSCAVVGSFIVVLTLRSLA
ncbi:MAG: GNVR domain-containing protein [Gammaproteobacteria bacterium]